LPGSIKRLIDALDVPLPNGPLDIRQRALAQADLVEPIERAGENLLRWAVFWIRNRLSQRARQIGNVSIAYALNLYGPAPTSMKRNLVKSDGQQWIALTPYDC
jgi:hypothetical protein